MVAAHLMLMISALPVSAAAQGFAYNPGPSKPARPHVPADNQMLVQAAWFGFRIGEISCPTKYFAEASSINFRRSVVYGLGVLTTSVQFRLQRMGLMRFALFRDGAEGRLRALEAPAA